MGTRCANHVTPLYPQKLALTSPTGGGRPVGMVRWRTKATEFSFFSVRCTTFFFYNKFISCRYMFRAHVLIIRRSKLHYTASGIITPIGDSLVHRTATYRCDDTRGCVMQFWPPGDEHMCSKHVEAWSKLIVKQKFCASSWLITEIKVTFWLLCQCVKNAELNWYELFY